jgi:hypothetical protein
VSMDVLARLAGNRCSVRASCTVLGFIAYDPAAQ